MPRAVAGDDEKKAMRACGAAAIRACLKFHVLANAKQHREQQETDLGTVLK